AVRELLRDLTAERALPPGQVARLARRLARTCGGDRLRDDLLRIRWVLLEKLGQTGIDGRLDEALHPRAAELRLRLALELRVLKLHRDDRTETFAHIVPLEMLLLLLQQAHVARELVQRARESRVEPRQMRAALVRVDVVGEGVDGLLVRGVPLHRDLDVAAVLVLALEIDDPLVDAVLRRVHVRDEVPDAALVVELDGLPAGPLVGEDDAQPARQERRLAQPLLEPVGRELDLVEDLCVW